jgi:hypothetical protein
MNGRDRHDFGALRITSIACKTDTAAHARIGFGRRRGGYCTWMLPAMPRAKGEQ